MWLYGSYAFNPTPRPHQYGDAVEKPVPSARKVRDPPLVAPFLAAENTVSSALTQ